MIVGTKMKFDAAHYLHDYAGKCKEMHGHTWIVEVEVSGEVNKKTGMIVDFAELKSDLHIVISFLDHTCLNDHFFFQSVNPTCENVATYIYDKLVARYNIQSVKVQEGDGGWAKV